MGAPYIYDISSLRVKEYNKNIVINWIKCLKEGIAKKWSCPTLRKFTKT
jgi:hypothetical protein